MESSPTPRYLEKIVQASFALPAVDGTDPTKRRSWMDGITNADIDNFRGIIIARVEAASFSDLLTKADFRLILYYWSSPIDQATMRAKFAHVLDDSSLLIIML